MKRSMVVSTIANVLLLLGGCVFPVQAQTTSEARKRGYPDVASDFCCAAIYLQGSWGWVGGTSWSSPTFAGIVNAAGEKSKSTKDELTKIYKECTSKLEYKADFHDITSGDTR